MRITTWAEYGLIVAVHLAGRGSDLPVPARDVAEQERLPADYIEQILLKLRRAGLVKSVRGAKGGYLLARAPHTISVKDVIEAAEEHTFEVNCEVRPVDAKRCRPGADCSIRPVWRALQERVDEFLSGVSLDDLLAEEAVVAEMLSQPTGIPA